METQSWMQDGGMVALGWTLLHFCWQGTAIALLYALLDRAAVGASAKVRYGIAIVALSLMPIAALVTFLEQQRLIVHVPHNGHDVLASHVGAMHAALVNDLPAAAPFAVSSEMWVAEHASSLLPWIDTFWLAGVLVLTIRAAGGWWQLERVRRRAGVAIPLQVDASFRRVSQRLHMGRSIALRISDEVISPLAMGIWRAAVVLPASAVLLLSPAQLEAVIAHELAHIRRWDYLCNLLQTTAECLLFFHPAVWWVSRCTRELREVCCDEVAARSCGDPIIYAEALLQMEEHRSEKLQLAMALKGHNGSLLMRVKQILGEGMMMERTMTSGVRVAVVGAIVLGLFLGSRAANGFQPKLPNLRLPNIQAADAIPLPPTPVGEAAAPKLHSPLPLPVSVAAVVAAPAPPPHTPAALTNSRDDASDEVKGPGADYLQKMHEAGYPLDLSKDLDQIISLRSVGVTPEYAKAMAQSGMGTPTLHDLISLKAVGVTPEYVSGLRASGIAPTNLHDVIAEKSVGVTPEYAKAIAAIGIGSPTVHDLIGLRAQGITPEYAAELNASGIRPKDLRELQSMKAVGVTPEYAKSMAAAGIPAVDSRDLVSLRAQGVTPEYARWLKQTFPGTDLNGLRQGAVFHVDADFIARAKSHGFNDLSLDKLLKLKMSGLLD